MSIQSLSMTSDLILVSEEAVSRKELLNKLSRLLHSKGYVKSSFEEAVIQREDQYPTGLQTRITGVAIPHADSEHVEKSALAVATLKHPVQFRAMDNPDNIIDVNIVIMMAIKKSEDQVLMLQQLMGVLQNDAALKKILNATEAEAIHDTLKEVIFSN